VGNYLEGKVVAITGGANGIGRAVALAAGAEGARVIVADYGGGVDGGGAGNSAAADAVVGEITGAGGTAVACTADVSKMAGGQAVVDAAVDAFGRIDGLLLCAGIAINKFIWEVTEEEWDAVLGVHLKGHFSCIRAATPVMIEQGSGSIVTIGSGAFIGMPNAVAYSTAKAAILGLSWSTANALGRFGITTNCIIPSAATRMSDSMFTKAGLLSNRFGDTMKSEMAEGTYRDPANMAPMSVYLLGDDARDINGQVFRVTGYEIAKMGMIPYPQVMTNVGPWDLDTIAARLRPELGPSLTPLPIAWPEHKA
jgi:NAD(P)-dependent dehydrogenase (short-subunit alcohol dehydrogenase family)